MRLIEKWIRDDKASKMRRTLEFWDCGGQARNRYQIRRKTMVGVAL